MTYTLCGVGIDTSHTSHILIANKNNLKLFANTFAYLYILLYLCTMKKDEIIELLKEQSRVLKEELESANNSVSSLVKQINELTERIKSLEELLAQNTTDESNRTSAR